MIREQVHTFTHHIPWVPEHEAQPERHGRRQNSAVRHHGRRNGGHNGGMRANAQRNTAEPRVFVRWQRWIASLAPQKRTRG